MVECAEKGKLSQAALLLSDGQLGQVFPPTLGTLFSQCCLSAVIREPLFQRSEKEGRDEEFHTSPEMYSFPEQDVRNQSAVSNSSDCII